MAIDADTKDCTALSDTELEEMATLSSEGVAGYDESTLAKAREEWVLITQAREGSSLAGFSFCTLERIGGTPCVLVGLGVVKRTAKRAAVLEALLGEQRRRAVLAFPDEDVLVAIRLITPSGFAAFADLHEVVPRPGHKATGEERAWARRLAKRYGVEGRVNDRTSTLEGSREAPSALDYELADPDSVDADKAAFFADLDQERGDSLMVFGWAMAEELAPLATR